MSMYADAKRQRMIGAVDNIFKPDSGNSLGSLPQGELKIRSDIVIVTSVDKDGDFSIGGQNSAKEVEQKLLVSGMNQLREKNKSILQKGGAAEKKDANASLTPDFLGPSQVVTQPLNLDAAADGGANFVTKDGISNPTNRMIPKA